MCLVCLCFSQHLLQELRPHFLGGDEQRVCAAREGPQNGHHPQASGRVDGGEGEEGGDEQHQLANHLLPGLGLQPPLLHLPHPLPSLPLHLLSVQDGHVSLLLSPSPALPIHIFTRLLSPHSSPISDHTANDESPASLRGGSSEP